MMTFSLYSIVSYFFFFFNDTATTEIYTLSYTTLFRSPATIAMASQPLWLREGGTFTGERNSSARSSRRAAMVSSVPCSSRDRKSTRLNSSHLVISYAVFCLKKKKKQIRYNRYAIATQQ